MNYTLLNSYGHVHAVNASLKEATDWLVGYQYSGLITLIYGTWSAINDLGNQVHCPNDRDFGLFVGELATVILKEASPFH